MPLTVIERDLNRYAQEKLTKTIMDVAESFAIAGINRSHGVACMGAMMTKTSALLAAAYGLSKDEYLQLCAENYDRESVEVNEREQTKGV